MRNSKKETKSILFLLIIITISLIITFFSALGMQQLNNSKGLNWSFYIIGYFIILIFFGWIEKKFPNKFFKYLVLFISAPIALFLLIFKFALPTIGLFMHILFFIMFSFAFPIILLKINDYYNYVELSNPTILFIKLTFTTCIAISLYKPILNFIYKFGPLRVKSDLMKDLKLDELTEYVLNKENIRFIIYTSFFIYLIVFSFNFLQNSNIIDGQNDKAIYQSFLSFLAFDRLLINSNMFILLPSTLLKKMIKSTTAKLN